MSDSVRPHRRQPTRLPHPWDSLGKNTGVGCHFLLQCMKVKSRSEVAQLCPTLSDPMDCSPPGSFIHGIVQARVLEWGAIIAFSLAIINSAAMNIGVHVSVSILVSSVCMPSSVTTFSFTVIQDYAPTSNAEEAEWFYEDLQDLLELTPQKDVLS